MKKLNLWMLLVVLFAGASSVHAQWYFTTPYFSADDMPDMRKFMPGPPDSLSPHFAYDVMQYQWGKKMRQDPERSEIAYRDAVYGLDCIIQEFSGPFGLQISQTNTPEIYKVLSEGTATCDKICTKIKPFYNRTRPFKKFNEQTLRPEFEPELLTNGSFPSGHTILGWSAALLLTEINPDRADTLLARGYMYGESRVIVGAHWQSDVDAAFMAASAAYAKLHTSDRFLQQMAKARQEFKKKTGGGTRVESVSQSPSAEQSREYTLSGTPATEQTRGVVVRQNAKVLKK